MPNIELMAAVILAAIIAITFHEASHGFVAWRLGDSTAYKLGRVTFNPIKHVDVLGTIVLPLLMFISAKVLFGWAKPVPVNPAQLNNPRRDMVLVAAAGPGINLLLALASGLLLSLYGLPEGIGRDDFLPKLFWLAQGELEARIGARLDFVQKLLFWSVYINVVLAVFNLIPLPPLDGGRIAVGLLPGALAFPLAKIEPYGIWILLGIIFILPLVTNQLGREINVFSSVIHPVVLWLMEAALSVTGVESG